ncbi:YeiH family protein [Marinibaculum pumilum]|uniref:YeiH family protein n=1 Tax=Marinibaculum pumilum TaxID=1766165 RepID=A0ABV7KX28_9PROT
MTSSLRDFLAGRARHAGTLLPGIAICLIIAAAARFLADHYGAPQMLFALLIGMAVHFLSEEPKSAPGIAFCSRTVLRLGVALLGLRITVGQVADLGLDAAAWIAAGVAATLAFGVALGRLLGPGGGLGLLSGGAVGICGASAALAISSVMPAHANQERNTTFVVVTVTTFSTLAMIFYPILAVQLGLDERHAGLFLGGTIHDVAQVVGAGYGLSTAVGDDSTITKLFRVALLVPVVLGLGLWFGLAGRRSGNRPSGAGAPPAASVSLRQALPVFVLAFCALVALNTLFPIPDGVRLPLVELSSWCLVTAIASIGVRTSLRSLAGVGPQAVLLMLAETAFLALWVLAGILWLV